MSEIKSPFSVMRTEYYFDTDELPRRILDEAETQRKVVLRAARIRPTKSSRLWELVINIAFWSLLGALIYWIGQLGFWDWIRSIFQ